MDSDSEGARVIVTDDDVDGALSLAALLRNELPPRVEVIVTHDGLEALEEASRMPPPLAVVLDLGMPGMTGLETACAIRRSSPAAKDAVLVAVSGDQNLLDNARRSGYFRMIQRKPIDFEALLRLLKSI
jgi:CheY-like chemotaxis protein